MSRLSVPSSARSTSPTIRCVLRPEVLDDRLVLDLGVDPPELLDGRCRLRGALLGILLVEQDLPLKVREFDEVPIDDPHEPDPSPHHRLGEHSAGRPAAADQHAGPTERGLPLRPDPGEQGLLGVAGRDGHGAGKAKVKSEKRKVKSAR